MSDSRETLDSAISEVNALLFVLMANQGDASRLDRGAIKLASGRATDALEKLLAPEPVMNSGIGFIDPMFWAGRQMD